MNYQFLQNKVHLHLLGLMIGWVFFLLPAQAKDNVPSQQNVLTEYFNKLQATESPLSAIKLSNSFWLKEQSKAILVNRFFYFHKPTKWQFSELQSAGDYSALTVSFDSIIWDRPWKTRFEFVKRDKQWKLTAFEDLTQRAVDDSKLSANDFVLAYLKQAGIAANLLNTTTDKDEKKRIEQYQISGAGFWKSNPIKSHLFILWLQQKTPTDWKLLETSVPSEATAKVTINFNGVKHHKTGYSLTFDIINENNHWLIKNYYNRQTQTRLETRKITSDIAAKEISNVQLNQDSAESVVRSQLKILEYASSGAGVSILSELAKKSKPLWLKSRKARASLGRMLGISANLKEPHQWILAKQGESAEKQTLIVTFTTPMKLLLIKGIRFIVLKQDDIWKIKEATLFR